MLPVVAVREPELGKWSAEEPAADEKSPLGERPGRVDAPWAQARVRELSRSAADSEAGRAGEWWARPGRRGEGGLEGLSGLLMALAM